MSQTQQVEHSDSISSQDPANDKTKKTKSRRPPNTAFRQQRLKAWQPILTPKTVLPIFFLVGIIFAPIGGLLLYASSQVQEVALDYTNCITQAPEVSVDGDNLSNFGDMPSDRVSIAFKHAVQKQPQWGRTRENYTWPSSKVLPTDVCYLEFTVPENNAIKPPIFLYYRLTNFYQNHRRYVRSFDPNQLKGDAISASTLRKGDCAPLAATDDPRGKPYYPCGLIANSMFNDTFEQLQSLNTVSDGSSNGIKNYSLSNTGIAWKSEADLYKNTKYQPDDVRPPPFWADQYVDGKYDKLPNLHEWEEFQVWMRTAGLPTFSKLSKRNDHDVMTPATYRLKIFDRFPASKYGGSKEVLISTRTVMGGKNPFLGIAYVVVGGLCILLGTVFTLTHLVKPRKLGDHTYLSWNNEQPSTATTTGRTGGA